MNDLLIPLKEDSRFPMYRQIYDHIKNEIQKGKMKAGEKLPSSRILAKNLCISRSTVDMAYDQLLAEGYIESVPCKGYYVCQMEGIYFDRKKKKFPEVNSGQKPSDTVYRWDFALNGIAPGGFPHNIWRKLSREVLSQEGDSLFQLGDPCGEPGIRQAVAEYLHSARGVDCDPGQIIIGAGNDYLLMLLWVILGKNRKIAMENPTYLSAYYDFLHMGSHILPVGQDEQGIRIEELEKTEADTVYVMPSHQFPMGMVMPLKRRTELLKWAGAREGRYIIEDDYDSEFRFTGLPIQALKSIDTTERVLYLNTFSRTLAPSLRISYMVLPSPLTELYRERLGFYSCTVPAIEQYTLAKFLDEGHFESHVNRMRVYYRGRRDEVLAAVRSSALGRRCQVRGEEAGLHFLLQLDTEREDRELAERCAELGIRLSFLSDYQLAPGSAPAHTLVIRYPELVPERLVQGLDQLAECL